MSSKTAVFATQFTAQENQSLRFPQGSPGNVKARMTRATRIAHGRAGFHSIGF